MDKKEFSKEKIEYQLKQLEDVQQRAAICKQDLEFLLAECKKPTEPEKPELRHGVCAIAETDPFVIIEQATLPGSPKAFYGDKGGLMAADENIRDYTILIPDLFADLKALAEPLEEFKVGTEIVFEGKFRNGDEIMMSLDDGANECSGYFGSDELDEIILKLRCLRAKMQAK